MDGYLRGSSSQNETEGVVIVKRGYFRRRGICLPDLMREQNWSCFNRVDKYLTQEMFQLSMLCVHIIDISLYYVKMYCTLFVKYFSLLLVM